MTKKETYRRFRYFAEAQIYRELTADEQRQLRRLNLEIDKIKIREVGVGWLYRTKAELDKAIDAVDRQLKELDAPEL